MGLLEDIFTATFHGEAPPPAPNWVEWIHITMGLTHCPVCLKLDRCWFLDDNKPTLPQHPHCHCTVKPIPISQVLNQATSECSINKFEGYIFSPKYSHNGKKKLFEGWGFCFQDSEMLKQEFEKQALESYIKGNYTLGRLNEQGQHIDIVIKLLRKDTEQTATVVSGWMVEPDGKIRCATPYGG